MVHLVWNVNIPNLKAVIISVAFHMLKIVMFKWDLTAIKQSILWWSSLLACFKYGQLNDKCITAVLEKYYLS